MLLLLEVREQDPRALLLLLEVLDERPQRAAEDVVGEHHDDGLAADEALRQPERLRDPALLLLVGVEEPVDAVRVTVAEQAEELPRVRSAGDEHELRDARVHERLDGVRHHRPVVEREQVLVRDPRQRIEPRALAARQNHALHAGGCYGLRVDQEDEQRDEPAAGDEDAHAPNVRCRCFEPVSAL